MVEFFSKMLLKKTTILSLSSVSALKIDHRNLVLLCFQKRFRSRANALIPHERKKWFQTMSLVWNSNTFDQLYALSIWLCKWRQWGDIKSKTKNSVSGPLFFYLTSRKVIMDWWAVIWFFTNFSFYWTHIWRNLFMKIGCRTTFPRPAYLGEISPKPITMLR